MTKAASSTEEVVIEGFPPVPDFVPAAEDGAEPSRAVDKCLGQLDRPAVGKYGGEAMQLTSMSVADVRASLRPLGAVEETNALRAFAEALKAFETEEGAGRSRRTAVEWLRGQDAPIEAFLERLERLVRAVPDISARRSAGWDMLSTTYRRGCEALADLGHHVQAGQLRTRELTSRIDEIEASGDADEANQLRKRRDAVERRTHLLRIIRARTADYLGPVREAAKARDRLSESLHALATRALPEWEAVLLAVAQAAYASRGNGSTLDVAPVTAANAKLLTAVAATLKVAADLAAACGSAESADPGSLEDIETRVMGSEANG